MDTYNASCSCGWSVTVDTMAKRDELDQQHDMLHRDNPGGDYRNLPPQP